MSKTPIFDLEQDMPGPGTLWLPRLIGLLLGLTIASLPILYDRGALPRWDWPAFNGLLLIPALYFAIAAHELGHLIAGKFAGIATGGIAVGGFVFLKSGGNWVFRFNRRACTGGYFKPLTNPDELIPSRYAWMVAGGPLTSLAMTIMCWFACIKYGNGIWDSISSLYWICLFLSIISLLPFSSGLTKTDGARLWMILRHPDQTRSWMAVLAVQTEEANGVRPRDWDPQMFGQMMAVPASAPEYPFCQMLTFYRRLDEGSETAALDHLENALASSARAGRAYQHAVFLEAASAGANIRKQAPLARTWCQRACKLRKPESLHAVRAGIAMCEGSYSEAATNWEAARARVVRRRLDSGLIRFAKEKWAEYESACRAAIE